MTHKQMLGAVVGVVFVVMVSIFVYRQYTSDTGTGNVLTVDTRMEKRAVPADTKKSVVPDTIDGIVGDIEAESSVDVSALNEEESGALDDVNQDSDSVNNLGTSYDENNL